MENDKMAGRPRPIDRGKVLDAAEALVLAESASALSFDTVAKAAGITNGDVQYAFRTRDNLIRSMITRWEEALDADAARRTGPDPFAQAVIRGHLAAMRDAEEAEPHDGAQHARDDYGRSRSTELASLAR